mgnify:CR=1 FL=1
MENKVLVISAVNFFEGGPLSVLKDCLSSLNSLADAGNLHIIALVHDKNLFKQNGFSNVEFVEFPNSRRSYFYRLYYEYFYFKKFAKKRNVSFWFSLHDITPNVGKVPQAVYCHNPSPFNTINYKDVYLQPTQFFFRLFYKYLYGINISRNKYVVVQQLWMKNEFEKMFGIVSEKIIVAKPEVPQLDVSVKPKDKQSRTVFFYPAFPRPFKNFEVICEAAKILQQNKAGDFEVILTIDGTENRYSSELVKKYGNLGHVKFVGLLSRSDVFDQYQSCDCLIFPSKLETWGLPISEYKNYGKAMIVASLPYAVETVGKYDKVFFFNPENSIELSDYMYKAIKDDNNSYHHTETINYPTPYTQNWNELFTLLLAK